MWKKLKENNFLRPLISYGSLFTSFGTLLCCALPSSLVLLGLGASLSNFLGRFPELIWLSEHKDWVFGLSLGMLGLSFLGLKASERLNCPIDKKTQCQETRKWSKPLLYVSLGINIVGASYAFLLPRFFN